MIIRVQLSMRNIITKSAPNPVSTFCGEHQFIEEYGNSMSKLKPIFVLLIFIFITACSEGPGPIKGTWKMNGIIPLTVTYSDKEKKLWG